MASLDTNVLVRWLVADDPLQTAQAEALIRQVLASNERLFIPVTVLLELEWVLRSAYKMKKPTIIAVLAALLESHELLIDAEPAVERALSLFRDGSADFADCLHLGLSSVAKQLPLKTFDRKAAALSGGQLID